jgi:WD40 repeat protein/energy-coupling factor transporter ATP-binding protein EcfA2
MDSTPDGVHVAEGSSRRENVADPGRVQTREDFARELTLLRERAGLTVRDVAKAINVPDSTVGGYFSGRYLPPVKPRSLVVSLLRACGEMDAVLIEDWMDALSRVRRAPGPRPAGAPVPYRGLASFQPEDAGWFYGRQRLTDALLSHLRSQYSAGGLLVAVGSSGSGKSSLLRAGVIPALKSGALGVPGSHAWPIALFTPGMQPFQELGRQLAALTGASAAHLTLADRIVLVIDQLEEMFTVCGEESERQAFIARLSSACNAAASTETGQNRDSDGIAQPIALVALGLRADFYPHALRYPELASALQEHQVVVGPMTEGELRSAIVEPAHKARLGIEDGLVELLLSDLFPVPSNDRPGDARGTGSLPLLSHALLTTWERSRKGKMTVADYRASGGIEGAVATTAEQVYSELADPQQEVARQIFVRLVHVSDDTADTRRRVSRSELLFGRGDASQILDLFIESRLITAGTDEVEIAHEALLYAWPRLREWIDADRAAIRLQGQLSIAAHVWQDSARDPSTLYRGGRLVTAREWMADSNNRDALSALESEFLGASTEQMLAEERIARRRTRRLQGLVAALAVLSLVAGLLSFFAFQQKQAATYQRNLAISRQVAIDANELRSTDINLAMQLSLAAYQISPTPEATSSLLESYQTPTVTRILGPPGVMESIAFTPNGRVMAAGGEDSTIRLWNVAALGRPVPLGPPLRGDTNTVFSVAFSPNGRTLASGSEDRTVRLWNVSNPARPVPWTHPLTGPTNTVYSVAFSPDGKILAAGSADDSVWLWNVANPRSPVRIGQPLHGPAGYVQSVTFSPNGRFLAAGCADGTTWMWNITIPTHPVRIGPLTGPNKTIFSVAFSPNGRILAAGSADNEVHLWDVADPAHPIPDGPPLTGPTSWVNSVAFSPDGKSIAAGSSDSNVWIWNLATRKVSLTLPHPAPVTAVVFLHNSSTIATSAADGIARVWRISGIPIGGFTAPIFSITFSRMHILGVVGEDNTARLWNVSNPRRPVPLGPALTNTTRSGPSSGAGALSPDGKTLVSCAISGSCQLWDVADPAKPLPLARFPAATADVQYVAFSPNGRLLAVTGDDHDVRLWNLTNPTNPVLVGKPLTSPTNYGFSVAFSPNGHLLAMGDADKNVYLWNITNPSRPIAFKPLRGASSYVYSVAFSPNGDILAEGSADDEVRLWDVANPYHPFLLGRPLTGPINYVYSVAFSNDGKTLAATAGDGSIWLWGVATPSQPSLLATLTGPTGAVFVDAFDGNQDILGTAGNDGEVRLWNTDAKQVAAYICSVAGDSVTSTEWHKYISGLPYNPPCRSR